VTAAIWAVRGRGAAATPGRPEDHPQIVTLVERIQGSADAELTSRWMAEQPDAVQVVRQGGRVVAFAVGVIVPTGSPLEREDPIVRTALAHVERTGPARPGEGIHVMRSMGGAEEMERDPYAVLVASVEALTTWLTRPLAWSFTAPTDEEFWGPFFDYIALERLSEVSVGGRRHVLHGIDWRRLSPDRWMDLMNDRERTGTTGPPPADLLRPAPLGREAFAAAVRGALRDLHRDDRLAASPLQGSRLAEGPAGCGAAGLRDSLLRGIAALGRRPRGAGLQRVLDRTFVRAAPTQEAAAEVLGLPFSTYRRHLATALDDLVELLWAVEIGEVALPVNTD
jgi:hypothetical protein